MENYFKVSLASFMAFAISSLLSYLVLPYNDVLASVIAWGAIIMLVIATFAFAVAIYCFVFETFTHTSHKGSLDEHAEAFEGIIEEMDTNALSYVETACDALEKIASASGDGTFDKQDIMRAAVDFRERANTVHRHNKILITARKYAPLNGTSELLRAYAKEKLFDGFADVVLNYLPESFHNTNYLNVNNYIYNCYELLKTHC